MANLIYNSFKKELMDGTIGDMTSVTIKVALVTSSYTANQDTHTRYSDITNELSTGSGYTSGGATLASKAVTVDNTDNEGVFDAADVTWSSSSLTARGAVVYKDTGVAGTSPLICFFDFGADYTSSSGNFTIQFNSEGIINLT